MSILFRTEATIALDREPTEIDIERASRAYREAWQCDHADIYGDCIVLFGDDRLSGATEDAHAHITQRLRTVLPHCRVETRWICLEPELAPEHVTEPDEEPDESANAPVEPVTEGQP